MAPETKLAVNASLKQIMSSDEKICDWFRHMPDTRVYSDYLLMIEVPMYLHNILQRLQNNYYTNKNSTLADMELIRENCYKYNEDNNDYYDLACEMYNKFKSLVDAIPEDPTDEFNESDHEATIRRGAGVARVTASTGPVHRSPNRSRRRLSLQRSSLASLPQPGSSERSLRRSTRSINNPPEETADVNQEVDLRQRNTRSSRSSRQTQVGSRNQDESQPTRKSSRSRTNQRYTEEESEQEEDMYTESEEEVQISNARTSRNSNSRRGSGNQNDCQQTRKSSRSRTKQRYLEEESERDEDDDQESEEEAQTRRKSSRNSSRQNSQPDEEPRATRTSQRSRAKTTYTTEEADESADESPPRHSASIRRGALVKNGSRRTAPTRNGPRGRKGGRDEGEDNDSYDESGVEESDEDDNSPTPKKPLPRIRVRLGNKSCNGSKSKSSPRKQSSPARASSRQRTNVSYTEKESDEDESYHNESSDEKDSEVDHTPKKKRSRSQLESIAYDGDSDSPQKKRGRASPSRKFISVFQINLLYNWDNSYPILRIDFRNSSKKRANILPISIKVAKCIRKTYS